MDEFCLICTEETSCNKPANRNRNNNLLKAKSMKRVIIFNILMVITAMAMAQLRATVGINPKNGSYVATPVWFNLSEVASALGTDCASLAQAVNAWKDGEYVAEDDNCLLALAETETADGYDKDCRGQYWLTADGGAAAWQDEMSRWTCSFSVYEQYNVLEVDVAVKPNTPASLGDCYHAVFALNVGGKSVTIDVTVNLMEQEYSGTRELDKIKEVGATEMEFTCLTENQLVETPIDLRQIIAAFGKNYVETTNIELYYNEADGGNVLYHQPQNYATIYDNNGANPVFVNLNNMPEDGRITINYTTAGVHDGDIRSIVLYLVVNDEYYTLNIKLTFVQQNVDKSSFETYTQSCDILHTYDCNFTLFPNDNYSFSYLRYNLSQIANLLGMTKKQLCSQLEQWKQRHVDVDTDYANEMIINLNDDGRMLQTGVTRSAFWLAADGKSADWTDAACAWYVQFEVHEAENLLMVGVCQKPDMLKKGDVCTVQIGLNWEGKMLIFDILMQIDTEEHGNLTKVDELTKVGEVVACIEGIDTIQVITLPVDINDVIGMYSSGEVTPYNVSLYVRSMDTPESITDKYTYQLDNVVSMTTYGYENTTGSTAQSYNLCYSPTEEGCLKAFYSPLDFAGGEHGTGSVFLVNDNEYVEVILDITFGSEHKTLESYNVVETISGDVILNVTGSFHTSRGSSINTLVQTEVDTEHITELLGTNAPCLYAEVLTDGIPSLTSTYTASPGQGFWLSNQDDRLRTAVYSEACQIGVFYSTGSFKWFENPINAKEGDQYALNLYLVNTDTGDAIRYVFQIRFDNNYIDSHPFYLSRIPQFDIVGDASGINAPSTVTPSSSFVSGSVYNLQGQRRNAVAYGLNIIDGRKVLVR